MGRLINFAEAILYGGITYGFYRLTFEATNFTQALILFAVMAGFGLLSVAMFFKFFVSLFKKKNYEAKETNASELQRTKEVRSRF